MSLANKGENLENLWVSLCPIERFGLYAVGDKFRL